MAEIEDPEDDVVAGELADVLADLTDDEIEDLGATAEDEFSGVDRAMSRFDRLVAKLRAKGMSEDAAKRTAAVIGRRKYGKSGFAALAAAGRAKKAKAAAMRSQSEHCWCGQIARSTGFCPEHATYDRVFPLLDYEIVRSGQGGDGRTVDAYVSVFDTETEINDQYGRYREAIHRSAFTRTLNKANLLDTVKVLLNHGMTLDGAPAPFGAIPIGVPIDIRADGRGLRTRTRYNDGDYADAVLSALKNGAMSGHSFRGRVHKSNPDRVPRITRGGQLPLVTRMELGLSEYGPTPIPFYADAGVVAIRSRAIAEAMRLPERERIVIARALLADEPAGTDLSDSTEPEDTTEPEASEVDTPDEGDNETSTTPDPDESEEDTGEVEDPEDDSPTADEESEVDDEPAPGTEGPPQEAPLPVSEAARSMTAADIARKARVALILRNAGEGGQSSWTA